MNIVFIIPLLQFLEVAENFLCEEVSSDQDDDNIVQVLSFINIIHLLLDVLEAIFNITKDTSRENDAYKLIHYCAEYR